MSQEQEVKEVNLPIIKKYKYIQVINLHKCPFDKVKKLADPETLFFLLGGRVQVPEGSPQAEYMETDTQFYAPEQSKLPVETGETRYFKFPIYIYDSFQKYTPLDKLQEVLNRQDRYEILKIFSYENNRKFCSFKILNEKISSEKTLLNTLKLTHHYGYPSNYYTSMGAGRIFGVLSGTILGLAVGVIATYLWVVALIGALTSFPSALVVIAASLGGGIFVGCAVLSVLIGAIIGMSIGALYHYWEKHNTLSQVQSPGSQFEDEDLDEDLLVVNRKPEENEENRIEEQKQADHHTHTDIFAKSPQKDSDKLTPSLFAKILLHG